MRLVLSRKNNTSINPIYAMVNYINVDRDGKRNNFIVLYLYILYILCFNCPFVSIFAVRNWVFQFSQTCCTRKYLVYIIRNMIYILLRYIFIILYQCIFKLRNGKRWNLIVERRRKNLNIIITYTYLYLILDEPKKVHHKRKIMIKVWINTF